jgi:phosphoribosylformimino-5-aminoimidazole carboxamide ribotide isomerase
MIAASETFSIIPVLDLKGGLVVRARAGERRSYVPIVTPLSASADPIAVTAGLLGAWPARRIYIADLDAIQGVGGHGALVARIAERFPHLELWVDAGFAGEEDLAAFALPRGARPVLGTESQRDEMFVRKIGDPAILSLDVRGKERLGPGSLHEDPSAWPATVIVMTLARVGMSGGPDLDRLRAVKTLAPDREIVAAGGVRDMSDVAVLRDIGISGALVATALHEGRIRRPERQGEA